MKSSLAIGSAYYDGAEWEGLVDYVVAAERLGVDTAWSAEGWGVDAVVPLAYLAAKTNRIKLGTGIIQISARVPAMIAMTAQSLDTVSNGRFILGLGVSGPQVVEGLHGVAFAKPLARLRECIEIIRLGLSGEKVQYAGEHYRLPRSGGEGKPIRLAQTPRPHLPIYLATLAPKALQLTGEVADGWIGSCFLPEHAEVFYKDLRLGAEKAGRTLNDLEIHVGGYFEISDDVERLVDKRRPALAFMLGGMGSAKTNFYNDVFCRSGYEDIAHEVKALWVAGKKDEAISRVPDELVLKANLIGTEKMVTERLRAFRDAGVNNLRLDTGGENWHERVATLEAAMDVLNRSEME